MKPKRLATSAALAKLLFDYGANINAKDQHGQTALIVAAKQGLLQVDKEGQRLLREKGHDPKVVQAVLKRYGRSNPDWFAAGTELAKRLLDYGADINAKDGKGWTALNWAQKMGNVKMVELLKARGAKE